MVCIMAIITATTQNEGGSLARPKRPTSAQIEKARAVLELEARLQAETAAEDLARKEQNRKESAAGFFLGFRNVLFIIFITTGALSSIAAVSNFTDDKHVGLYSASSQTASPRPSTLPRPTPTHYGRLVRPIYTFDEAGNHKVNTHASGLAVAIMFLSQGIRGKDGDVYLALAGALGSFYLAWRVYPGRKVKVG